VRVDHRRGDVAVAEKLLDRPDVVTILQEVRREGMAKGVVVVVPASSPVDGV
jgi:hypothetical protein